MEKNRITSNTFGRFVVVGVINTAFGAGLMFILYNAFGCSYWFSSACNYIFGSILSFVLNKRFTFRNNEKGLGPVLRFILTIAVCYVAAYGIAKPLVSSVLAGYGKTVQENGAMLVGMVGFTILNYLGQKFYAFANRK